MIEFYNVKKKEKVKISEEEVQKVKFEKESKNGSIRIRYAFKAVDEDGTKLTKFCSESDYNSLK
tara:strand:+ start:434 stop:625 length:192 start_codon:yes stop_codon:yes gene_type:complete